MLELKNVSYHVTKDGADVALIDEITLQVPHGHFMAIVGPSGCGKTTLLKTIAGLNPESAGQLIWEGRDLSRDDDFSPLEIGYVPQFSIAYDPLTVDESIEAVTRLRVRTASNQALDARIDRVLAETGLDAIADRQVKVLSGGQKRRLGLAMELVSNPKILLCDEVTSGLDPRSERDVVNLLHDLSRKNGRLVLSVTHSLAHLERVDSVLVMHEGRIAYHGPPNQLCHYFSVNDSEEIYPKLATQEASAWHASWLKHREHYQNKLERQRFALLDSGELLEPAEADGARSLDLPGFFSQMMTLLGRRWKIFYRDRTQMLLQLAIIIAFPLLVTLFSEKASGNIRRFSDTRQTNLMAEIQEQQSVRGDQAKVGSAVSGIIMFQIILLSLMGSNNSAREIAGERSIFEKEKFGGLRPTAYLASKFVFLGILVVIQSLWMAFFVDAFGAFRGDFMTHAIFLFMANAAMTSICLGISALMRTAEQASLLSIYLVGFQLPLSGAVLALPEVIEPYTQPFISAYWAWSGSVNALQQQVHHAVKSVVDTNMAASDTGMWILAIHLSVGLLAGWLGTRRPHWD
ncbi:MAG: ATP-binding cassette domain-containing protein [Verrucomicrobia bacterium]|nr:MAG: ATP-binding cassette domain-containing protein [Verrucomicrobiota bacterium]